MPYTFTLPSITDLSRGQKIALNATVQDVLIISGCPGSGKTTVSLLRSKDRGSDVKYHFSVWANLLFGYLINLAPQLRVDESHFSTFYSWFYSLYQTFVFDANGIKIDVIVDKFKNTDEYLYNEFQLDEGQDLPAEVRCAISYISKKLIICMDPAQDVNGECQIGIDEIEKTKNILKNYGKEVEHFKLNTNWRNTKPIFEFSKNIIPELNSQTNVKEFLKEKGILPTVYELDGNERIIAKIIEIIENEPGRNIGIFDDSLHNLKQIEIGLNNAQINTTRYNNREHRKRTKYEKVSFLKNMSNVVLATFISCKGLEFNTVIISNISILSDDLNKKKGYYVGCTRAQDRLILFKDTSSYNLPNWFQQIDKSLYSVLNDNANVELF